MKQATLEKLRQAAREDAVRLLYLDEAGFHGSPPVQRSWSPRGLPHQVEPNHHCRRSVIGVLDFGKNTLIHAAHAGTIKAADVECFIDSVLASASALPTVIVLDNASIHHGISDATRQRWLLEHKVILFYLPAYSPELNMIEIVGIGPFVVSSLVIKAMGGPQALIAWLAGALLATLYGFVWS